ncbi:hypothetical protein NDU88_004107 [Pleurodeles waltl]|uniref:Uncharacterized protein n=1 Tax=Pleurodeles waltl TaxID=8319 RepID=A0AAV7PD23_PLEWA|nr:hypothetical protein NDU88_004107 [Pleurodeles waltl]
MLETLEVSVKKINITVYIETVTTVINDEISSNGKVIFNYVMSNDGEFTGLNGDSTIEKANINISHLTVGIKEMKNILVST